MIKTRKTYLTSPVYRYHKVTKERIKFVTLERLIQEIMDDFTCSKYSAHRIVFDLYTDSSVKYWQDTKVSYSLIDPAAGEFPIDRS